MKNKVSLLNELNRITTYSIAFSFVSMSFIYRVFKKKVIELQSAIASELLCV
jgi:hypothetical protein